jgi:NTE family protein
MNVRTLQPRRGTRPPRTAFVLGGGGNLGAIQVGMLQALLERGCVPDLVLGCSVGALNAGAIAADPTPDGVAKLRKVWLDPETWRVFSPSRMNGPWLLLRRGHSMVSNERLRGLVESTFTHRRFEDFAVPLHVVAASLRTGRARWFSSGAVVEAVLASAALPAVLPPVEIDGELFIDGAVVDNVPIGQAIAMGAERVIVLHVGNFERPRPHPRRPLDVLLQSLSIARNERFLRERDVQHDGCEVIVLPGVDPGPMKRNDFSRTAELITRGCSTTSTFLDTNGVAAVI